MSLGERKRKILKAIIDEYIEHGEPVGSKAIAQHTGLKLSPATIRNEMSDLENMGYLQQLHVSSGRIPSQAGYRLYVDELMNRHMLSLNEMEAINQGLSLKMKELDELVRGISKVMAQLTNYTTYAVVSGASEVCIKKFDLMLTDSRTVVVIMLSSRHDIRNTYLKTAFPISEEELSVLNRMLNQHFTNLTLDKIDMLLVRRAEREMGRLGALVAPIINFAAEVMEQGTESNVYVGGQTRLLSHPEYRDTAKAQRLLDFISERKGINTADDEGVHIAIGDENNEEALSEASVIYGSYGKGTPMQGTLGIVGPVRMDYAKAAASLDYFLTGLNKLLRETFSIEEE